ncbi:ribonuclease P protein component [Dyella sp.]|uniref:ribonuclease P protein component n=1 Tax=Dyella sp. TaxID=1869338 RepID=UPI002ECFCC55
MSAAGLPREARLRRASDFAALRQNSGRASSRCFAARYRANGLDQPRLGLAISKRVSKRAVDRNRLKRLVRESFRRIRHELPSIDILIVARDHAVDVPGRELLADMDALWARLKPLKLGDSAGTMVR